MSSHDRREQAGLQQKEAEVSVDIAGDTV